MKQNNKGFTLLEVLVALFILTGGIIAVMQMLPASILQARMAAERTMGAQVARTVLGSIRSSSAASLMSGTLETYSLTLDNVNTPEVETLLNLERGNGIFGYQTVFQPLPGAGETNLQRITFILNYADDRTETFVTYVSDQ